MAPDSFTHHAERALVKREASRLVDIVMGRADTRTVTAHYLITDSSNVSMVGPATLRCIEQYRDLERVVSTAADCETGHSRNKCVGAFTATYVDGKLAAIAMVEDLPALVAAEIEKRPEDRLCSMRGAPMLRVVDDRELAQQFHDAAEQGVIDEVKEIMARGL